MEYQTTPRKIHVLQRKSFNKVYVRSCLVNIIRHITYCGAYSHAAEVRGGLLSYIHEAGYEGCMNMHRYHEYKGLAGITIANLKPNATSTSHQVLAGTLKTDGSCNGVTYSSNGETWDYAIVKASISITLSDYWATVKLDQNEISLQGGIVCNYLDGHCIDTEKGETYWNILPQQECDQYNLLYSGKGQIVTQRNAAESRKFLVVDHRDKVFALTLLKPNEVCGAIVWITEHLRIFVEEVPLNGTLTKIGSPVFAPEEVDMGLYMNSKFLYVEQSFKTTLAELSIYTVHRRCLLHREILKNRLALASLTPQWAATLIKGQIGYMGRVAGEVMYILQCTPKVVEIRRINTCYVELPVTVDNQSLFMAPTTRILQQYAEQIECNTVMPPLYQLDSQWASFAPHPTPVHPPIVLDPNVEVPLKFSAIQNIGSGGIYTTAEIKKAHEAMLFGVERVAINNIITNSLAGKQVDHQGLSMVNLFNPNELHQLAANTAEKLWGWFTFIGTWTSGILGIYFIGRLIKFAFEIIINATAIHNLYGWSYRMLACVWDTLTLWVLHKATMTQATDTDPTYISEPLPVTAPIDQNTQTDQLTEVTTTPAPSTLYDPMQVDLSRMRASHVSQVWI